MYGKIIDGAFVAAPKKLIIGGNQVWNAPAAEYAALGWKPVTFTDPPAAPDGYYYQCGWEETEDAIVETWTLEEFQGDDYDAAGRILMGVEE